MESSVLSVGAHDTSVVDMTVIGPPIVPVVTSITPNNGTSLGGTPVSIGGSNFTGATNATVGGIALTSMVVVNDNTITGVTASHAAAAVDVVVTAPGGIGTGAGIYTYNATFDPATLSLTGWWRDYPGASPWGGTASAGSSGSHAMAGGSAPSAGSTLNSKPTADFNGLNQAIASSVNIPSLISNGAGSLVALFNARTAAADPGATAPYNSPAFLVDVGVGDFDFGYNASGVRGGYYNGSAWNSQVAAANTGSWHLAQMRWDGTTLGIRVDSGSWQNVSFSAATLFATAGTMGQSFGASYFDGRVAELMTAQSALSDPNFDSIKSYINARYGLSL